MVTVDVIVDPENLPRIRLLQAHMRDLQVHLKLHEAMPAEHSARLIYVPRKTDSRLNQLPATQAERIALYLDEGAEQIDADLAVQLYSWPARSSDPHVRTLAQHLNKPLAAPDEKSEPPNPHLANKKGNSERRTNVITLSVIGAVVLAVMLLMELGGEAPEQHRSTAPAPDLNAAVEPLDAPTAAAASAPRKRPTPAQQAAQTGDTSSSAPLIARPSSAEPSGTGLSGAALSGTAPRQKQTLTPCAGATDILRARLRWQLPTDLEPCAS